MLFNSLEFLIFFPAVVAAYYLLPHKYRWVLLLAASYYFYMAWKAVYIVLILFSTVVDYLISQRLGSEESEPNRKKLLWLSLFTNLGLLAFFKYFNFFQSNVNVLLGDLGLEYMIPASTFLLPMGISFYTFQTMAYTVDVYNRKIEPEKHPGYFALYVTYFPQLVAGPIERAQNLLHQFRLTQSFDQARVVEGLQQMLWGFFKKMVIADRVSAAVTLAYADPASMDGLSLLLATYLFAFQIYCDFSGYSDIAIGASKVLGIKLMDNFRTPYLSSNISEFWNRWHISLSTWFRDYLYIPLGGNRVVKWRWYYNLMLVFLVSGFWHGANWTFIVWGFLHGSYLVLAIWFKKFNEGLSSALRLNKNLKIKRGINMFITFHLAVLAWIYFRAENVGEGNIVLQKILSFDYSASALKAFFQAYGMNKLLGIMALVIFFVIIDPFMDRVIKQRMSMPTWAKYIVYPVLAALILLAGSFGKVDFIYFQF
jgi:D-alanyl-lipoteichoic acid acyltransferase DltB (MBOAT superfamily)